MEELCVWLFKKGKYEVQDLKNESLLYLVWEIEVIKLMNRLGMTLHTKSI